MPRKVFVAGEILTAADVNTNLMDQAVMVFDDSTARGSAIPSPTEGMVTYLKDTNQVQAYNGSAFAPLGTILQVVSTVKTDTFTMSSTTFADVTGLSATITPSSATSKIYVVVTGNAGSQVGVTAIFGRLLRDSTAICIGDAAGSRTRASFDTITANSSFTSALAINFLDSPNTTSAVTYKLQIAGSSANAVYINRSHVDSDAASASRQASTITLMEVAG